MVNQDFGYLGQNSDDLFWVWKVTNRGIIETSLHHLSGWFL